MKKYIYIIALLSTGLAFGQQPFINGIDKRSGTPNEIVTISGSNFSSPTPPAVYFGNGQVTTVLPGNTASLIQVRVPATATYGPVTVENLNGLSASSSENFTVAFDDDAELATWNDLPTPSVAIPTNQSWTYDICLCDFDGDGFNDAIITNNESINFNIALNQGSLTVPFEDDGGDPLDFVTVAESEGNKPFNSTCSDLNGDGKPDLVFSSAGVGEPFVHVYENTSTTGNITFIKRELLTLPTLDGNQRLPKRVRIADFNGDGLKDIVVGSTSADNELYIYENTSSGIVSFDENENVIEVSNVPNTGSVFASDLDEDGRIDLVVHPTGEGNEPIYLLRNTSTGGDFSFEDAGTVGSGNDRRNVVVADFNQDGLPDIAATTNSGLNIFKNNGGFEFEQESSVAATSLWGLDVGDMNGDGWVDIVAGGIPDGVYYAENTSATVGGAISFATIVSETTAGVVRNLKLGDINGDAKPDISFVDDSSPGQNGDFRFILNDLCMTPVISPSTSEAGEYCTNSDYLLTATEGFNVTYSWDVSSDDPGETSNILNLNGNAYTGNKNITVVATMADGCVSSTSAIVTVNHDNTDSPAGQPTIQAAGGVTEICVQTQLDLQATSPAATNYYWYGPNGLISSCTGATCAVTVSAEAVNSGDYYLIVDNGNCQSPQSAPVTISVTGPPIINIEEENCNDGNITLVAPDYTSSFSYQWKRDGSNVSTGSEITVSTPGDYTLEITEGSCTRVSNLINIPVAPTSSFEIHGLSNDMVCLQATSTGAGGTLGYNWSITPPSGPVQVFTTSDVEVSLGASSGTVSVTLETIYSDAIGCSVVSDSYDIVTELQPFPLVVSDLMSNVVSDGDGGTAIFDKCPSDTLRLSFAEFGTGITNILWDSLGSDPINNSTLDIVASGTYVANYTTSTGCETAVSIEVSNFDDLQLTADNPDIVDGVVQLADGDLSVVLSVDMAVTNITWTIDDVVSTETGTSIEITPERAFAIVEVTGTTADGCEETEEIRINSGTFLADKSFSPNGDGMGNDCWGIVNSSSLTGCTVYILDTRGKNILVQELPGEVPEDVDCIWDGTSNGVQVPEGIYYFVLKCQDGSNNQTGSILLAR